MYDVCVCVHERSWLCLCMHDVCVCVCVHERSCLCLCMHDVCVHERSCLFLNVCVSNDVSPHRSLTGFVFAFRLYSFVPFFLFLPQWHAPSSASSWCRRPSGCGSSRTPSRRGSQSSRCREPPSENVGPWKVCRSRALRRVYCQPNSIRMHTYLCVAVHACRESVVVSFAMVNSPRTP